MYSSLISTIKTRNEAQKLYDDAVNYLKDVPHQKWLFFLHLAEHKYGYHTLQYVRSNGGIANM